MYYTTDVLVCNALSNYLDKSECHGTLVGDRVMQQLIRHDVLIAIRHQGYRLSVIFFMRTNLQTTKTIYDDDKPRKHIDIYR